MYNQDYLVHYGKIGMHWGRRSMRSQLGLPNTVGKQQLTKKRQLDADKKTLDDLKTGGHDSIGLSKKRQAKFDARDISILEKRVKKNEYLTSKEGKAAISEGKKKVNKLLLGIGATVVSAGVLSTVKIPPIKTGT